MSLHVTIQATTDARKIVTHLNQRATKGQRIIAWAILKAERGQTVSQINLQKMQEMAAG